MTGEWGSTYSQLAAPGEPSGWAAPADVSSGSAVALCEWLRDTQCSSSRFPAAEPPGRTEVSNSPGNTPGPSSQAQRRRPGLRPPVPSRQPRTQALPGQGLSAEPHASMPNSQWELRFLRPAQLRQPIRKGCAGGGPSFRFCGSIPLLGLTLRLLFRDECFFQ